MNSNLTLSLCLTLSAAWSGWAGAQSAVPVYPSNPSSGTFSDGFQAGYRDGEEDGYDEGYDDGFDDGAGSTLEVCRDDPAGCGISLGTCLAAPAYGETEPNDNIVSADALVQGAQFWGQSYSQQDEDWYYIVTTTQNQNLAINFSVSNGPPTGWVISIRDAAGNVFAEFDTGLVPGVTSSNGDLSYYVTLGLVGTYYIVVRPKVLNYNPYRLTGVLQDSVLDTNNFVIGFFDAELEFNNGPSDANRIASGISMFGLINLAFEPGNLRIRADEGFVYDQGVDEDWYVYWSTGNEMINLAVCAREVCDAGQWLFEVYNEASGWAVARGEYAAPMLAVNSGNGAPDQFVFGLREPQSVFMRVQHKKLLTAPCVEYAVDADKNGLVDPEALPCACDNGYSCDLTIANPGGPAASSCPDGTTTTADQDGAADPLPQCDVVCRCVAYGDTIETQANALTSQYNFTWHATKLPPNTADTDAYRDFLSRPNPYLP